jgi:hypothetical protein
MNSNRVIYLLPLLILLGASTRLPYLEITGLWMDEIHSAIGAEPSKGISEVIEYCKTDQPPFFFLLLHEWYKSLGYNDFAGRLLG